MLKGLYEYVKNNGGFKWENIGDWFLEEEGCFTMFNGCEELEIFMNTEEDL